MSVTGSGRGLDRRTILGLASGLASGLGLSALLSPNFAWAISQPDVSPRVREVVERWVGAGKFPGIVTSLGQAGQDAHYVASGIEGFTDHDAITPDSLFRIYSMTKPITGMAAMQLVAEGRIGLDQPLYDILPQFRHMQVQDQYDGSLQAVHPAKGPITIRHLLTHTAGLGYTIIQKGPIKDLMQKQGLVPAQVSRLEMAKAAWGTPIQGLDAFAEALSKIPLVAEPGTRWSYSVGLDLMGRVIEVVTGQPFDRYLHNTIFGPSGMSSTWFQVPKAQAHRLTTNYAAFGELLMPIDGGMDSIFLEKPAFAFGGAGLVSSPRDYDRFLRVLAQFGTIEGTRVFSEQAVRLGTSDLLPAGVTTTVGGRGPAGFGAGGRVGKGAEAGTFGWTGAAGTVASVDMNKGIRAQIFVQFMPPNASRLLPEYYAALKDDVMAILEKS